MNDAERAAYPVLIVEDDSDQAERYENAIKKACQGEIVVDIEMAATGEKGIGLLQERLWPFVSLDQKIPMKTRGQVADEHGVAVGKVARAYQPLQLLTVLTGFPGLEPYRQLNWPGVEYLEKGKDVAGATDYGKLFVDRLRDFEAEGVWRLGKDVLPAPLAMCCANYLRHADSFSLERLKQWEFLVDNGLQMLFFMCVAMIRELEGPAWQILKRLQGAFWKTGAIAHNIEDALSTLEECLSETGHRSEVRELQRFFHNSQFLKAVTTCPALRNKWTHSARTSDNDWLHEFARENRSWFVSWTLSCGFWSLHPMVVNLEVVPRGATYGLKGTPLRGRGEPLDLQSWDWDGKLVADKKQVYQVICSPEHQERALVISLHPLIRLARCEQGRAVWVAHDPAKNVYRNLMNSDTQEFDDTSLVDWWSEMRPAGPRPDILPLALPEVQPEPSPLPGEAEQPPVGGLNYEAESQSWYVESLPDTREISADEASRLAPNIDVVLITATPEERKAVWGRLRPLPRRRKVLRAYVGPETYFLGRFGSFQSVLTMCRMGSTGESSATLATEQALRVWSPRAIIMVGLAFGKGPEKQKIGDVLVATQVIPYENQRVGTEQIVFRAPIPPSNAKLLNRFRNAPNWEFARPDGRGCQLIEGPVLSGEKLIDDPEFKARLFAQYPDAIGGEMEGAGLCAASGRVETPWILVKSICDWADGKKGEKHQPLAAAAATSLVHHVLSQKTVLD